jgi:DNA-binding transcriptional ArsR family regulator
MSKNWKTKEQIILLLKERRMTLTDISSRLGLAPSTVSQHMKELAALGAIREADEQFSRKWRYYEAVAGFSIERTGHPTLVLARRIAATAAVAVIAILVLLYALHGTPAVPQAPVTVGNNITAGSTAQAQQQQSIAAEPASIAPGVMVPGGSTLVSVSDAPALYNLSGVYLTVNAIEVRSASGANYTLPLTNTTFNLVDLRNISMMLSASKLPQGNYTGITLMLSGARVKVNGTSEPLAMPSQNITLEQNITIMGNTTNWVNLDINLAHSLHVTTTNGFAMLPVVNLSITHNATLRLNSTGIVEHSHGVSEHALFGMGEHGREHKGYNASVNSGAYTASGLLLNMSEGTLEVQGNDSLLIDVGDINVSTAIATIANSTGRYRHIGEFNLTGNESVSCSAENGSLLCSTNARANYSMIHNVENSIDGLSNSIDSLGVNATLGSPGGRGYGRDRNPGEGGSGPLVTITDSTSTEVTTTVPSQPPNPISTTVNITGGFGLG